MVQLCREAFLHSSMSVNKEETKVNPYSTSLLELSTNIYLSRVLVLWSCTYVPALYLSVCLSVGRSAFLSVCLSVCLSICLSFYQSVCLYFCLSIFLSVSLSVCLSRCLSDYLCPASLAWFFLYLQREGQLGVLWRTLFPLLWINTRQTLTLSKTWKITEFVNTSVNNKDLMFTPLRLLIKS